MKRGRARERVVNFTIVGWETRKSLLVQCRDEAKMVKFKIRAQMMIERRIEEEREREM